MKKKIEFEARVIGGGRITIPQEYRELLGIEVGDRVRVQIVDVIKLPKAKSKRG